MSDDLKPCPFCGGEAEMDTQQAYRNIRTGAVESACAIYCTECSAQHTFCYPDAPGMERDTVIDQVIAAWNRRPAQAEESGSQPRSERQRQVAEWCAAAFGVEHQASVPQRAVRFLEEAIEAYQAATHGALGSLEAEAMAHNLLTYVFSRPVGELRQELGGVGLTVLALAAAAGVDADASEVAEIQRVTSKPLEHFHARNAVKNAAGFDVTGAAYPTGTPAEARGDQALSDAAEHMRPILEMYEREAKVRLPGRGRERFEALADALRTLMGQARAIEVIEHEVRADLSPTPPKAEADNA